MNRDIYRFKFDRRVPMDSVASSIFLATLAAEALHGRAELLLDGAFYLDEKRHRCIVDARSAVGRTIARIFTGFLGHEFDEDLFDIERIPGPPNPESKKDCPCKGS